MTLRTRVEDYIIGKDSKQQTAKPMMLKIAQQDDDSVSGILELMPHLERKTITFDRKDILVNLGPDPKPGKVYGIEASRRFIATVNHPWWGPIHFLTKTNKGQRKLLKDSLDRTARKLEKSPFKRYANQFITEIVPKVGKYAGMYVSSHKEDVPNRILYTLDMPETSGEFQDYVAVHEFMHHVWFHGVTGKKIRARWLSLYNESIAQVIVPPDVLKGLKKKLSKFENEEGTLVSFFREMASEDEDVKDQLKIVLKWFKDVHHLSGPDLGMLWDAGQFEELYNLWPTQSIDSSKLAPLISEYACKNVRECFAEAMALEFTGKKQVKKVKTLIDKTIAGHLL